MLTFHLGSTRSPLIGYITHTEEWLFEELTSSRVAFINKLWREFYSSPHFNQAELQLAQRKLLALAEEMALKPKPADETRLNFIYKLAALVTHALVHGQDLYTLSD